MRSNIATHDPISGDAVAVTPDPNVVWSSAANWHGLTVEQYCFVKAFETPEFGTSDHHIVLRLSPPSVVELSIDGKDDRQLHGPGDITLFPAGVPRRVRTRQAHEVLIVAVSQPLIAQAASNHGTKIELVPHHRFRNEQLECIGKALKAEADSNYVSGALYGESLALALAAHLVRNHATDPHALREYKGGIARLGRVLDYIHDNLAGELRMGSLAAIAGLSPYRFAHNFKRATDMSPHQYVIHARVDRGKQLLRETDLSVLDISYAVGCQSPSRFALLFRRETGMTPSRYRISIRR
jgi:AraC family transcriptional regulator